MDWSPQQIEALDAVGEWLRTGSNGPQIFRLFGFAGTGKTTLAKHLAESAGGTTLFAAYTGKAAYVLRSKGCRGASTIHSLIYQPRERGTSRIDDLQSQLDELLAELHGEARMEGDDNPNFDMNETVRRLRADIEEERRLHRRPMFQLKEHSDLREADLLVIDECSMVDDQMAHDILSFGVKVLSLGDPAQLPPVKGSGYFTEAKPNILLTEIHRQARGNPIIDLATRVRMGQPLKRGEYGLSKVIHASEATKDMYLAHDQMLVGTNKMRRACNLEYRRLLGRDAGPFPVTGDRVICLRNNHDKGLLNGSLWNVVSSEPHGDRIVLGVDPADGVGAPQTVIAHRHFFVGEEPPFFHLKEAECFDYGYAITCHKSQGSQWDKVLVLDESAVFKESRDRWLYTAITRAAESVTVVQR